MENKSLYKRFEKVYLSEFPNKRIVWSNLDKFGNLTVGIYSDEESYFLNVREYPNGEIYWY